MSGHTFQVLKGSSEKIIQSETRRTPANDEVLVRITHAGSCGTDLHVKDQDMVLGHKGVGVVQEVGSVVKSFNPGYRAGRGFLHDACLQCYDCPTGNGIFCNERKVYVENDRDQGGFGSHAIWKAAFLFHIPDAISSAHAAPLMCAGTTVFNAMKMHGLRPTERVGILGIGGLGHLAIQFVSKAKVLGATEFYVTEGDEVLKNVKPVGHPYVTTSEMPDWENSRSARCDLTDDGDLRQLFSSIQPSLAKGLRIQWVMVSSRALHNKMLHFVAQHHVEPIVREFPLTVEGIEEAMKKLADGETRYRAVLVAKP